MPPDRVRGPRLGLLSSSSSFSSRLHASTSWLSFPPAFIWHCSAIGSARSYLSGAPSPRSLLPSPLLSPPPPPVSAAIDGWRVQSWQASIRAAVPGGGERSPTHRFKMLIGCPTHSHQDVPPTAGQFNPSGWTPKPPPVHRSPPVPMVTTAGWRLT